ncbi:hypothetical protein [Gemmatimonas sp.]|uniref:hypothetical protein n=1 Tax=Gemmatimonas sp. TaxID=1962908 RepID=UPI00286D8722|nr:hypothetical protein [Gemmatimonas sp.]
MTPPRWDRLPLGRLSTRILAAEVRTLRTTDRGDRALGFAAHDGTIAGVWRD